MKTTSEVAAKISQLVQGSIAQGSGSDRFTSAVGGNASLIVGARDAEGIERNFRITVEEAPDAGSCCGAPVCEKTAEVAQPSDKPAELEAVGAK